MNLHAAVWETFKPCLEYEEDGKRVFDENHEDMKQALSALKCNRETNENAHIQLKLAREKGYMVFDSSRGDLMYIQNPYNIYYGWQQVWTIDYDANGKPRDNMEVKNVLDFLKRYKTVSS